MQLSCDCGNKFLVDAADHGKPVHCPTCRAAIRVPDDRGDKPAPRPLVEEPDDALIGFVCPGCGNAMKARASYAGRPTRCPKCQAAVTIPGKESRRSSLEKKSSGGRILGIAVGILLLIGGIVVAVLFTSWGGRKGDIDDLSLVPADAQGLVCIKVGALWETPVVRKAIRDARRDDIGKQLEAETGLKPEDVERATVVLTDAKEGQGWAVIKTKNPYDGEALKARIRDPQPKSHLDHPYTVGVDSQRRPIVLALVGPRVLVVGNEEGVRRALALIGSPVVKGPLTPVVEMCRKEDHVVFGFNPGPDANLGKVPGIALDLSALNDMDLLLGTLNIREKVELDVRARTASREKADDLRGAANGWLSAGKGVLLFAKLQGGEKGKQAAQVSKLLDALKLSVEDKDVVATMKADADLVLPLLGATR